MTGAYDDARMLLRLELRYRVYSIAQVLFWCEEIDYLAKDLKRLYDDEETENKKAFSKKSWKEQRFQNLSSIGWIDKTLCESAIKVLCTRNDIAHRFLKPMGSISIPEGGSFEVKGRRIEIDQAFPWDAPELARSVAFEFAGIHAKRSGASGNLAAYFTPQSVLANTLSELIEEEIDDIVSQYDKVQRT